MSFPEDPLGRSPEERDLDNQTWYSVWYLWFALIVLVGIMVLAAVLVDEQNRKKNRDKGPGQAPPVQVAPGEDKNDRP